MKRAALMLLAAVAAIFAPVTRAAAQGCDFTNIPWQLKTDLSQPVPTNVRFVLDGGVIDEPPETLTVVNVAGAAVTAHGTAADDVCGSGPYWIYTLEHELDPDTAYQFDLGNGAGEDAGVGAMVTPTGLYLDPNSFRTAAGPDHDAPAAPHVTAGEWRQDCTAFGESPDGCDEWSSGDCTALMGRQLAHLTPFREPDGESPSNIEFVEACIRFYDGTDGACGLSEYGFDAGGGDAMTGVRCFFDEKGELPGDRHDDGPEFEYRLRAIDVAGNAGPWSDWRDGDFTSSGWDDHGVSWCSARRRADPDRAGFLAVAGLAMLIWRRGRRR